MRSSIIARKGGNTEKRLSKLANGSFAIAIFIVFSAGWSVIHKEKDHTSFANNIMFAATKGEFKFPVRFVEGDKAIFW